MNLASLDRFVIPNQTIFMKQNALAFYYSASTSKNEAPVPKIFVVCTFAVDVSVP